jgi:hypothetical protein
VRPKGSGTLDVVSRNWLTGLTATLAVFYACIGINAGIGQVAGIVGAVVIVSALPDRGLPRWLREILLVIGAVPLAVFTWWSVVTPVLAILVIAIGSIAVRGDEKMLTATTA